MRKKICCSLLVLVGIVFGILILNFNCISKTSGTAAGSRSQNLIEKKTVEKYTKNLVGIWHGSPTAGAGFQDRYEFLNDKRFIFKYSQYDGEKRVVDFSGRWTIIYNNLLQLTVTAKTIIEGGEFTKDVTSETTKYVLENGAIKKVKVNPPQIVIYPLSDIKIDNKYPNPIHMTIGGIQFWKLGGGSKVIQ